MKNLQTLLNTKFNAGLDVDGDAGRLTKEATTDFVLSEITKRSWTAPKTDLVYLRLDQSLTNTFDDVVARFVGGKVDMVAPCSTTAGDYYIFNPITSGGIKGTAIACEQQLIASHRFVSSKNWATLWLKGPYFQQEKDMRIYRDGNMDRKLDRAVLQAGKFGINWHRAGIGNFINNWSAGCMVTPDAYWWEIIRAFNVGQLYNFTLIEV